MNKDMIKINVWKCEHCRIIFEDREDAEEHSKQESCWN